MDQKAEEMSTKIKNAFYSVGVEEGFRRGFKRPDVEFKVYRVRLVFDPADRAFVDAIETVETQDRYIEELLNNGWWLTDKIICPPNVMLIFSREKETEENERKQ